MLLLLVILLPHLHYLQIWQETRRRLQELVLRMLQEPLNLQASKEARVVLPLNLRQMKFGNFLT